ncbi:MAG: AraC family transcriptional regulator [Candidatus Acidiferrales bacterium]
MPEPMSFLPAEELRRKLSYPERSTSQSPTQALKGTSGRLEIRKTLPPGTPDAIAIQKAGLPTARLKRILAYIDAHLDENITLAELARNANLSVYYFATLFRESTGFSPHRYILHRRVTRARELLRNTSLSVLDVSLDLGFQHQNNFARAFRRITGMTPTYFRRSKRSDK